MQWYYWRWRIESFFKLRKSAVHQVEHWQQETAEAIAKRLLVATMTCVVVWQLAHSEEPEANALRQLLVRLSERQMKWRGIYRLGLIDRARDTVGDAECRRAV